MTIYISKKSTAEEKMKAVEGLNVVGENALGVATNVVAKTSKGLLPLKGALAHAKFMAFSKLKELGLAKRIFFTDEDEITIEMENGVVSLDFSKFFTTGEVTYTVKIPNESGELFELLTRTDKVNPLV